MIAMMRRRFLSFLPYVCLLIAVAAFNRSTDFAYRLTTPAGPPSLAQATLNDEEKLIVYGIAKLGKYPMSRLPNRPHLLKGLIDLDVIHPPKVEHLLFASSIGFPIRAGDLDVGLDEFVNLSMEGSSIYDYLTWAQIMHEYGVHPERVVFSITPWTLTRERDRMHPSLFAFTSDALLAVNAVTAAEAETIRGSRPSMPTWDANEPSFFDHWSPSYLQFNIEQLWEHARLTREAGAALPILGKFGYIHSDLSFDYQGVRMPSPQVVQDKIDAEDPGKPPHRVSYERLHYDLETVRFCKTLFDFYRQRGTMVEVLFTPISKARYTAQRSRCERDGRTWNLEYNVRFLEQFIRDQNLVVRGSHGNFDSLTNQGFKDHIHLTPAACRANVRTIAPQQSVSIAPGSRSAR